jgi:hypothetical protein
MPQRPSLGAHRKPTLPLIQMGQQHRELRRQRLLGLLGLSHTTSMTVRRSKVNVIS